MNLEDQEIGYPIVMGMRIELSSSVTLLMDSRTRFEIIALEIDQSGKGTMFGTTEGGAFKTIRRGTTNAAKFSLESLNPSSRYLVGIYAPQGILENVLLTISEPRSHIIMNADDAAGIIVGTIYNRMGEWKFKMEGSHFKEGLPAIIQAYMN